MHIVIVICYSYSTISEFTHYIHYYKDLIVSFYAQGN